MIARATTHVSILQGTTTNAAGDVIDNDTPVASGIPASIVDLGLSKQQASRSGALRAYAGNRQDGRRPRDLRAYTGRLPALIRDFSGNPLEIAPGNRLRDERNGTVYLVDGRGETAGLTRVGDLRVDLRRVA